MAIIFLTFACLSITALAQRFDDPRYWAYPEFYDISRADGKTQFQCAKADGSRCAFQEDDFAKAHYGTGQNSINIESSVWAASTVDAVLTLTDCLLDSEPCRVTCNANCTCTVVGTNEPCTAGVSLAPTPVPVVAPTAAKVCPNITNVQHCPELMQNSLPAGNEGLFDCYNFCGGSFVSACSEGKCGSAECPEAGEAGSLMGVVTGCTTEHLNVQLAEPTKPASSAAAPSMVLSSFALLTLLTFVTIC